MRHIVNLICLLVVVNATTIYQPKEDGRKNLGGVRPRSPVVDPRKFILQNLCESPSVSSEVLFEKLRKRRFPASDKGLFESIFEEYQGKIRIPSHLFEILKGMASGVNVEHNALLLDRQIESFVRRGLDRESMERNIALWFGNCVEPLVNTNSTPCQYSVVTGEWTMSENMARAFFCSEYHSIILH